MKLSDLQTLKAAGHITIGEGEGAYEWPVYKLMWGDFMDGSLVHFLELAQDGELSSGDLLAKNQAIVKHILWLLMRKGAPEMTAERVLRGDWNTTAEGLANVLPPATCEGESLIVAAARLAGLISGGEDEVVNPSPASP